MFSQPDHSETNGQRYLIQVRDRSGGGVEAMRFASVPVTASKIAALLAREWPQHEIEIVDLWGVSTRTGGSNLRDQR